jgi:hypothetical protein
VNEPEVIPSPVDPDCECVKLAAGERLASPPPGEDSLAPELCPEGYVPRRRRGPAYELRGKQVITGQPPEVNPDPPPG